MSDNRAAPTSLIDSLEQDLTQHAQAAAAEEITVLRQIVKDNPLPSSNVAVYEHPVLLPLLFLLAAAGLGYALYNVGLESVLEENAKMQAVWGAGALVVAIGLYRFVYKVITFWNTPVMTLSAEGVHIRGVEHPIHWQVIDDYETIESSISSGFVSMNSSYGVVFHLVDGHVPQWPRRQPSRFIQYRKKKNQIALEIRGISVSLKKLSGYIVTYRNHALARARLAELGE